MQRNDHDRVACKRSKILPQVYVSILFLAKLTAGSLEKEKIVYLSIGQRCKKYSFYITLKKHLDVMELSLSFFKA
jgi:hypothetical protein